jgi:hypothetical protein
MRNADDTSLDALTEQLRALRLERLRVESQIHDVQSVIEGRPQQQQEQHQRRRQHPRPKPNVSLFSTQFSVGDNVRITNRVRRPTSWPVNDTWEAAAERNATVTGIDPTSGRVNITTGNGHRTWRNAKFLRHSD